MGKNQCKGQFQQMKTKKINSMRQDGTLSIHISEWRLKSILYARFRKISSKIRQCKKMPTTVRRFAGKNLSKNSRKRNKINKDHSWECYQTSKKRKSVRLPMKRRYQKKEDKKMTSPKSFSMAMLIL